MVANNEQDLEARARKLVNELGLFCRGTDLIAVIRAFQDVRRPLEQQLVEQEILVDKLCSSIGSAIQPPVRPAPRSSIRPSRPNS